MLPNDPDSIGVAEAAAHEAEEPGVHVVVIPTRAQVQGIAALAVHEPGRPLDSDVVQMAAAARGARHGAVTVAAKDAMTTAGPVLGGRRARAWSTATSRSSARTSTRSPRGVLERLLGGGGELVTLVAGAEAGDLAEACEHWVEQAHPGRRRRRLRGRPGALPVADGGGVAVVGGAGRLGLARRRGRAASTPRRSSRRPASRRSATCSGIYPRRYVAQGLAERARASSTRATCSPWSARWSRRCQKTYQDRRTHRTAYRLEVRVRAEDGSLLLTYFDKHKHTADWRADQELPGGQRRACSAAG